MRKIGIASTLVAITLAAGFASAQTPPPAPGGPFDSLSPGNQKIALAIFDSEQRLGSTTSTTPLSLDQIAQMKQSGKGWGEIFHEMKAQRLVADKNLGQAVSRRSRGGAGSSAPPTEITTASGKTVTVGGNGRSQAAISSGSRRAGLDEARGDRGTSAAVGLGHEGSSGGSAMSAGGGNAMGSGGGNHGVGRGK
jgi:hypothetical protein